MVRLYAFSAVIFSIIVAVSSIRGYRLIDFFRTSSWQPQGVGAVNHK